MLKRAVKAFMSHKISQRSAHMLVQEFLTHPISKPSPEYLSVLCNSKDPQLLAELQATLEAERT